MPNSLRTALLSGWGLLTAWGLVSLSLDTPATPGGPVFANVFTTLASITSCLVLLGLLHIPALQRTFHQLTVWGAGALVSACSAINLFTQQLHLPVISTLVVQGIASLAYIVLMYRWFMVYASNDPQEIESGAIAATAVCAVVCVIGHFLPSVVVQMLWIALPLVSALCLALLPSQTSSVNSDTCVSSMQITATPASDSMTMHSLAWKMSLFGIAACGFVLTFPGNLLAFTGWSGTGDVPRLGNLGGLALAAVLILWFVSSAQRIALSSLFKLLYPLAAVGLLLAALPYQGFSVVGAMFVSAGQWALYVFVWIYTAERSHEHGDIVHHFVASRIAFDAGGTLSALLVMGLAVLFRNAQLSTWLPYVLFAALAFFMVVSTLLPSPGQAAEDPLVHTQLESSVSESDTPETNMAQLAARTSQSVAHTYGLSQREEQILALLLRGYSTARIRNELVIAKGTVDTHIQRIYQKCGVHSRQELVELTENITA